MGMDLVKTIVVREPWDVDRRLSELRLTRKGLLAARDVALHESANATPFHPANTAGALHPPDRGTDADVELFGRFTAGTSCFNKANDPHSQFTRIPSTHWLTPRESMR
jgi:hypothetical protein